MAVGEKSNPYDVAMGRVLRRFRHDLGFSQSVMANFLGLRTLEDKPRQQVLSNIEKGERRMLVSEIVEWSVLIAQHHPLTAEEIRREFSDSPFVLRSGGGIQTPGAVGQKTRRKDERMEMHPVLEELYELGEKGERGARALDPIVPQRLAFRAHYLSLSGHKDRRDRLFAVTESALEIFDAETKDMSLADMGDGVRVGRGGRRLIRTTVPISSVKKITVAKTGGPYTSPAAQEPPDEVSVTIALDTEVEQFGSEISLPLDGDVEHAEDSRLRREFWTQAENVGRALIEKPE